MDKDGRGAEEEVGGLEGRKTVTSIHHVGKKSIVDKGSKTKF